MATGKGFQVFDGTAKTGVGNAKFAYEQTGLLRRKTWQVFGKFEQLNLEPGLRKLLPQKLQAEWDKYSPRGTLDLKFHFWDRSGRVEKNLKAELKNASFEHTSVPFRLVDRRCLHLSPREVESTRYRLDFVFLVVSLLVVVLHLIVCAGAKTVRIPRAHQYARRFVADASRRRRPVSSS